MPQAKRRSVIPLKNGIQVKGMRGWTPVFTGVTVRRERRKGQLCKSLGFEPRVV